MDNVIYAAVYFAVTLGAFLIGKYVCPNIPKTVTDKLGELSEWAAKFVEWAKEFKKDKTGEEKMAAVVEQLKKIADEAGLNVTEDQLKAIAQAAYNAMKAGEKESNTAEPLEALTATPAATVVINTTAPVTTTEKVAIATDNVPEGATETNADGTVNLYDAAGNITGSVTKEEASTPSGSTALNKSLGGAVINPSLRLMQVTEIAGIHHNAYRSLGSPLILGDEDVVRFETDFSENAVLGIDTDIYELKDHDVIEARLSKRVAHFCDYRHVSFVKRLRKSYL